MSTANYSESKLGHLSLVCLPLPNLTFKMATSVGLVAGPALKVSYEYTFTTEKIFVIHSKIGNTFWTQKDNKETSMLCSDFIIYCLLCNLLHC